MTIELLLHLIDTGYNKKAWHGPNLRGCIRRVDAGLAAWRPAPERHNIWENVVHCAYWKYTLRRRLLGEKRGSFALKGSNWFVRPGPDRSWEEDVALLDEMHRTLRAAIEMLDPATLPAKSPGSRFNNYELISGIAAHDVYHAGQIQILKRLRGATDTE